MDPERDDGGDQDRAADERVDDKAIGEGHAASWSSSDRAREIDVAALLHDTRVRG